MAHEKWRDEPSRSCGKYRSGDECDPHIHRRPRRRPSRVDLRRAGNVRKFAELEPPAIGFGEAPVLVGAFQSLFLPSAVIKWQFWISFMPCSSGTTLGRTCPTKTPGAIVSRM